MTMYRIENSGCDDSTVENIDLSHEELDAVCRVVNALNAKSEYGCQPTITIVKIGDES